MLLVFIPIISTNNDITCWLYLKCIWHHWWGATSSRSSGTELSQIQTSSETQPPQSCSTVCVVRHCTWMGVSIMANVYQHDPRLFPKYWNITKLNSSIIVNFHNIHTDKHRLHPPFMNQLLGYKFVSFHSWSWINHLEWKKWNDYLTMLHVLNHFKNNQQ